MKLLIRAPFIESERKRLETYFDEIVYDPWTTTGERYYEDEMLCTINGCRQTFALSRLI